MPVSRPARWAARTPDRSLLSIPPASPLRAQLESLERRVLFTRFAIAGDFAETTGFNLVSAMMEGWNPAHIISLGDNNNNDDDDLEGTIGAKFHEWMSPYLGNMGSGSSSGNRFWPVLGNHDWDGGINNYLNYFTLPNNERYYSVKLGEVEWFMMDSDQREPSGTSSTSTQAQWLQNALANSTAAWQIVAFHHPAYSSASVPDNTWMRWPFKSWGADVIMSGHDHLYERLDVSGLAAFTVGTGGAGLHSFGTTDPNSKFRYDSTHGAMRLDASNTQLVFQFFNRNGTLIDSATLNQGGSPPPPPPPPPPPGSSVTFIPTGSSWKYLDNGTNQGTAWKNAIFAETNWKTGNAQLGYGDGDEATVVSYGGSSSNKFVTTYFRKSFNVNNPSSVTALNLRLRRDDGAVVYLNGTEIFRSNMPGGTIGYQTFASAGIEDESFKTATISPSLLASGNNVIAVEVHQSDRTSSDVSFDFELTAMQTANPVPAAPSGLLTTANGANQIDLTWTDNASDETGYKVERSTDGVNFTTVASNGPANATSYSDTNLISGRQYWYRVRAFNSAGDSQASNIDDATTVLTPPAPPSGLAASAASASQINLTWIDSANNESGFILERSTDGVNFTPLPVTIAANGTSYSDTGLSSGTQYWYQLRANNGAGASDPSNITDATTGAATAPAAPTNLSATAVSNTQINLLWQDQSNNEDNFVLERSPDGVDNWQQIATPAANATSYSDSTGLSPGVTYFYRIRAVNAVGPSGDSNTALATTLNNSLPAPWTKGDIGSVGAAGSATYSNGVYNIKASGSDVEGTTDHFTYVYRQWTGNGQIIARVPAPIGGPAGAFQGIMFRESLATNSKHASALLMNGVAGFVRRTNTGGSSSASNASVSAPQWLKVIRNGNSFTAYRSSNGTSWTQIGSAVTVSMAATIHVGMLACSTRAGTLADFAFDGVQVSTSTSSSLPGTLSASMTAFSETQILSAEAPAEKRELLELLA